MITINCGVRLQRRGRIVEKSFYVFMQRALIALKRQGVIAVPLDDFLSNVALAIEGIDRDDRAKGLNQVLGPFEIKIVCRRVIFGNRAVPAALE